MRLTIIFIFAIFSHQVVGQKIGRIYKDNFGHSLELNGDSTFRYEWRFDLIQNWSIGTWEFSDRTITLNFKPVYDTLKRANRPDSLILSIDESSNVRNAEVYQSRILLLGGQDNDGNTSKLFIKGKRLFHVKKNGKLDRSKRSGIWPQKKWLWGYKKWPTYYVKEF